MANRIARNADQGGGSGSQRAGNQRAGKQNHGTPQGTRPSAGNPGAGQPGGAQPGHNDDAQLRRPGPGTGNLRDAPGYEAGRRAKDRGVGSLDHQGEVGVLDGGVDANAFVVARDGGAGDGQATSSEVGENGGR